MALSVYYCVIFYVQHNKVKLVTIQPFLFATPDFEDWITQGCKGRPLPRDSIFHPEFIHDDNDNGI